MAWSRRTSRVARLGAVLALAVLPFSAEAASGRGRIKPPPGLSEITPGPTCTPRCSTVCQRTSCAGLTPGQCSRARNDCRTVCTSRC